MNKRALIISIVILLVVGISFVFAHQMNKPEISHIELPVPYLSQVPNGVWVNPWASACEETSLSMVDAYYTKEPLIESTARQNMKAMFEWENQTFGKNFSTTAEETSLLAAEHTHFKTEIKPKPTLDEIKNELRNKRPVIAFIDQFTLNLKPRQEVASFHVVVIVGFDDAKQEFIISDPASPERNYPYMRMMEALHDYDEVTDEALGEPVVLFTRQKSFLK